MNTLLAPATVPLQGPSRGLAESCLNSALTWTTEPDKSPLHDGQPLWSELLRFGLHGAALGMVTGLSIVLVDKIAQVLA